MRLVKKLWQHQGAKEVTWEREDTIRTHYPFLFDDECMFFYHLILNDYSICMRMYVFVCVNFGDEILLRREECKTRTKLNFSKKMAKR